jgi:hypothetical protein
MGMETFYLHFWMLSTKEGWWGAYTFSYGSIVFLAAEWHLYYYANDVYSRFGASQAPIKVGGIHGPPSTTDRVKWNDLGANIVYSGHVHAYSSPYNSNGTYFCLPGTPANWGNIFSIVTMDSVGKGIYQQQSYMVPDATPFSSETIITGKDVGVILASPVDTIKPVVTAVSWLDSVHVKVEFSEKIENISAASITNYAVNRSVNIFSAIPKFYGGNSVVLTTSGVDLASAVIDGLKYILSVKGVRDLAENSNEMDSASFELQPFFTGSERAASRNAHPLAAISLKVGNNPFKTAVKFFVKGDGKGSESLMLYNAIGNRIANLSAMLSGRSDKERQVIWNGGVFPSGQYVAVYRCGAANISSKILLIR